MLVGKTTNIIWHPQRESNSQLTLRRGLLYPFNYGGVHLSIAHFFFKCNSFLKFSLRAFGTNVPKFCGKICSVLLFTERLFRGIIPP